MAEFGELLLELRKDHNLSQAELGKIIFVSGGTISNYENGVHLPEIVKLISLAEFFRVSTDYLLGRCSSQLSPDAFEEEVINGVNIGKFIKDIKCFPQERRQALTLILSDMAWKASFDTYSKESI